jgi:phosphatidylinositol 4-kinase type 2
MSIQLAAPVAFFGQAPHTLTKIPSISTFASLIASKDNLTSELSKRPTVHRPSPIRIESGPDPIPLDMKKSLIYVSMGLIDGVKLQLVEEGMGGTYFCRDQNGRTHAVFKPSDEEPCAPSNPKSLSGLLGSDGIKPGIKSGEQADREMAAYLLDHQGFAGVPSTLLVKVDTDSAKVTKRGSFQVFINSASPSGDFGSSLFATKDVQAIAALDIRLVNTDRHDGNILVQKVVDHSALTTTYKLVPIDHGCCLPDRIQVAALEWVWMSWPQIKQPILPFVREAILAVNIDTDSQVLRGLNIRSECIRTMRIATLCLQTCVSLGKKDMTLFDIATFMSRAEFDKPSELEHIVAQCRWKAAVCCIINDKKQKHIREDFESVFEEILVDSIVSRFM